MEQREKEEGWLIAFSVVSTYSSISED